MGQKRLDSRQILALKKIICKSDKCGELCKKTMLWMLDQSKGMTKEVYINIPKKFFKLGELIGFGIHDIHHDTKFYKHANLTKKIRFGSSCSSSDDGGWGAWLGHDFRPSSKAKSARTKIDDKLMAEIVEIKLVS